MTTTAVEPRTTTDLGDGILSTPTGLEITRELTFNEWQRLMQTLARTADRTLWSWGDARAYGDRFAKDYHDGVAQVDAASRIFAIAGRVARAFPPDRRRGQLSFEVHAIVASQEPADQERWLDEVERQGWGREQLAFAFAESLPTLPAVALSVRLVADYHRLAVAAAERRSMDPKEWVLEAIREKASREHVTLEEVAA